MLSHWYLLITTECCLSCITVAANTSWTFLLLLLLLHSIHLAKHMVLVLWSSHRKCNTPAFAQRGFACISLFPPGTRARTEIYSNTLLLLFKPFMQERKKEQTDSGPTKTFHENTVIWMCLDLISSPPWQYRSGRKLWWHAAWRSWLASAPYVTGSVEYWTETEITLGNH